MAAVNVPVLTEESATKRETFFRIVFDKAPDGFVCIARRVARKGAFDERFFHWPDQLTDMGEYIAESVLHHDVWFCPMLFDGPGRKKERVDACPAVWADLDTCNPKELLVPATIVVESSPERWQALWLLDRPAEPLEAEDASKRVAYFHAEQGADKSGWDLTQLLRVPYTYNHKYDPAAIVMVKSAGDHVDLTAFNIYPVVNEDVSAMWPFPDSIEDSATILERFKNDLDPSVWRLIQLEPTEDWSKALWNLEMLLCESQLQREDVFSIARDARCNKYRRDGRSDRMLWREVCKAWARVAERNEITPDATVYKPAELLSDGDLVAAKQDQTFVEEYVDWAKSVGDAAEQYHPAGGFMCLSGLLAGTIQLPTSFGTMAPNLWFMLLADTTLTRKSTAMDLAVDMLVDVDSEAILATDGSIEGLFSAIALRPGRPSLFLRDEFSGLVEMMNRREYYAGMSETLTKMYDGKYQRRQLRREVIEVREPVLLMFTAGIKTKVLSLLDDQYIRSGFLPRFVFVTATSNLSKVRGLGPPTTRNIERRETLVNKLRQMKTRYSRTIEVKAGSIKVPMPDRPEVTLTAQAWQLYNALETRMLESGLRSQSQDLLTPMMDRLAKSGLKTAMLIAASRMRDRVIVDEGDLIKAFAYVTEWREYAMDVVSGVGTSRTEHQIGLVFQAIQREPGVTRSIIMRNYHLTKRDADTIFDTLEQRGLINRVRVGNTEKLSARLQ